MHGSFLCHAKAYATPSALHSGPYTRRSGAGTTLLQSRSRTSSHESCGPSGTSSDRLDRRRPARSDGTDTFVFRRGTARARSHDGIPVGPARGCADNSPGPSRSLNSDWRPARGFHDGPERTRSPMRPKIRLPSDHWCPRSSESSAATLRARQGHATCGGALRAALTRARAAASLHLCDEGNLRRSGHERSMPTRAFLIDGGVQIRGVRCPLASR